MHIITRYRRLSLWNKIAFWGSLASIFGVAIFVWNTIDTARRQFSEPITISRVYDEIDSFIYEGVSDERPIEDVRQTLPAISSTPFLSFSVRSDAEKHTVQFAPYLLIDVLSAEPFAPQMLALFEAQRGAGGEQREFKGMLRPVTGLQLAPHLDPYDRTLKQVDFFTLAPGEIEEVFLNLGFYPGYKFTYRIGLQYRYQDKDRTLWLPDTYERGVPNTELPVSHFGRAYVVSFHPDSYEEDVAITQSRYTEFQDEVEQFVQQTRVFSPRDVDLQVAD